MSRSNNTGVRTRKRIIGYYDYNLLACLILLLSFGLIVLYSASAYEAYASANISDNMYFFRHQLRNSAIALIWAVLLSKISYHFMARFAGALYAAGFVLMALVQTPLGVEELGARRWLRIGPIQFQPSEVAKIGVIVFLPMVLLKMGKKYKS
ncbi:MAG: FtsW/RodA/SpoVE family cell cycle protein [Lacrimispora saccharolytica]